MRGYRGVVWFVLGTGVLGACAAAYFELAANDASVNTPVGYGVVLGDPIEVPEAPRLWENDPAYLSSVPLADDPAIQPEPAELAEAGVCRLGEVLDDSGLVSQVVYEEPPLPEGYVGHDIASSPAERPANPLRRDQQGFVLPEGEASQQIVAPAVRSDLPLPAMQRPETSAMERRESLQQPVVQTAMSRQPLDRLPPPQADAIHEMLSKESADAVASQDAEAVEVKLAWQEPASLLGDLEALAKDRTARAWAEPAWRLTEQLNQEAAEGSTKAKATFARLVAVAAQASPFAAKLENLNTARRVRQAGFALGRRLDVWREVPPLAEAAITRSAPHSLDNLDACLARFHAVTADSREGLAWRQFLLTDAMRQQIKSGDNEEAVRRLAQESLRRLDRASMSAAQKRFLAGAAATALRAELLRAASGPVELDALLATLEQYEQTCTPGDARRLAEMCRVLDFTVDPTQERLDRCLETHYRNANLRLAISETLLNRFMPQRPAETAPVYDNVMGVDVYGESISTSQLAIRLLPSPDRVRMALEVTGTVNSLTTSSSGPATFHNNGTAVYTAFKPLEIDMRGIRMEPTQIDVRNDVRLQHLETNFEGVPLLSPLVRGIARQQYEQSRPEAAREMRGKVAATARQRVDTETTARLQEFAANFNKKVLHPLNTLDLQPVVVAAETTPERFLMRLRLAGDDQLGSHTPRPQAPSDSLASVQIHESALNNALVRLELDGKTFSLAELSRRIAEKFETLDAVEINPENEDVSIQFADSDAIQVHCSEGQISLTLQIARLSKGSRAWRDFQVRANYKPLVEGRRAELVRDGVIHLSGKRLNTGAQIALRGIFSRTFSRKTPWVLTPDEVMKNPALADQAISQFTIDDGWIGAALGPKPTVAARPSLLHR